MIAHPYAEETSRRRGNSNWPEVTIVVPNYNKESFVKDSIESALSQTFQNFELVFVDGASTDQSVHVVKSLMSRDKRIRLIRHPVNLGVSAARNDGIKSARGEIIAMLDSDDVYAPDFLDKHLRVLRSESLPTVVMSNAWKMNEKGERTSEKYNNAYDGSGFIFSHLLAGILYGGRMVVPKLCLQKVGLFDETLPFGEDYDLALRLAKYFQFSYVKESLYGYRSYSGNTKFRISRRQQCLYHANTVEKHMNANIAILDTSDKKDVLRHLFHHLIGARDYRRLTKYGISSVTGFKILEEILFRAAFNRLAKE